MTFPPGTRLVSTLPIRERRKTAAELKAMSIEDRLMYQISHPMTEEEQQEALEREMAWVDYDTSGEVDHEIILANDPPPDWGD